MDVSTPPPLQTLPTSRERKYDRQLRLWAASGQAALEDAHILCINNGTGVTGVETLKNLVLPGIGQFTLQDSSMVTEADLGINFFLDKHTVGTYRAESCARLLQELNPDVRAHAVTEVSLAVAISRNLEAPANISQPLTSWLAQPTVLDPFTLVLVTSPIKSDLLEILARHTRQQNIPLIHVQSVGYYSVFSLSLPPAYPIVDTHPDPETTVDLRLANPWPELTAMTRQKTANLDSLGAADLAHVPYLLLLLHFLDQSRSSHNGEIPSNSKEKQQFRDLVRAAGPPNEENFEEAANAVLRTVKPSTPPSSLLAVLQSSEAQNLTAASSSFWFIARAIDEFVKAHSQLPLPGAVPDMKSRSTDYIALQTIYKTKARKDCQDVIDIVRQLEHQYGRPGSLAAPDAEIEAFCKKAATIRLLRGRYAAVDRVTAPMNWDKTSAQTALNAAMGLSPAALAIWISFLAYNRFASTHNADAFGTSPLVPGLDDSRVDSDARKLTDTGHTILDAMIKAAGSFMEDPLYSEIKSTIETTCQEL